MTFLHGLRMLLRKKINVNILIKIEKSYHKNDFLLYQKYENIGKIEIPICWAKLLVLLQKSYNYILNTLEKSSKQLHETIIIIYTKKNYVEIITSRLECFSAIHKRIMITFVFIPVYIVYLKDKQSHC